MCTVEFVARKLGRLIYRQASPRSFDSAQQSLCCEIDPRGAALRMTALGGKNVCLVHIITKTSSKKPGSQDDGFGVGIEEPRRSSAAMRALPARTTSVGRLVRKGTDQYVSFSANSNSRGSPALITWPKFPAPNAVDTLMKLG
jgi:hypothetical protein